MLHEAIARNRYSYDESRNLSCAREYRAFQTPQSPAVLLSAPLHRKRSPSPLKRGGWGALQRQSRGASILFNMRTVYLLYETTPPRHFERWQGNWSHSSEHDLKERQRRTNHCESLIAVLQGAEGD